MKTHIEMFEALLAGETLTQVNNPALQIRLVNGIITAGSDYVVDVLLTQPCFWKLKPKTININGYEVPVPERIEPERGTEYFVPYLHRAAGTNSYLWDGGSEDRKRLQNGLVHLTRAAAAQHSEALLSFTRG